RRQPRDGHRRPERPARRLGPDDAGLHEPAPHDGPAPRPVPVSLLRVLRARPPRDGGRSHRDASLMATDVVTVVHPGAPAIPRMRVSERTVAILYGGTALAVIGLMGIAGLVLRFTQADVLD